MIHNANEKDKLHLLARPLDHRSLRPITDSIYIPHCELKQLASHFIELVEQLQTEEEPLTQGEEPNKVQSEEPDDEAREK